MFDEIYEHLTANRLLSDKQSGFRPGDSTINQLLSVTNAFEHHHDTRAVFLLIFRKRLTECGMRGSRSSLNQMVSAATC